MSMYQLNNTIDSKLLKQITKTHDDMRLARIKNGDIDTSRTRNKSDARCRGKCKKRFDKLNMRQVEYKHTVKGNPRSSLVYYCVECYKNYISKR